MRILVTGSSGHLGEALVRTLRKTSHELVSIDIAPSEFTSVTGSIADRDLVAQCMHGVDAVLHTATLHKPHVATHTRQQFIDANITGTLNLLEEAVLARVKSFVFTSTTSVYGDALIPAAGLPAAWIDEDATSVPKNIYGVTKVAAENLCQLFHRNQKLPCLILRTSRFFPEPDDDPGMRAAFSDANIKANEYLSRRVALDDVVSAHLLAMEQAPAIGFDRFVISATTPFTREDLAQLREDGASVLARHAPSYEKIYASLGWKMFAGLDRVYVNAHAREKLGWRPKIDFAHVLEQLELGKGLTSELASEIGIKGYHQGSYQDGVYPI
ncbi:MAG: NAD(P)-dependent oxidoreductase [Betaproteobacteria bacterium]